MDQPLSTAEPEHWDQETDLLVFGSGAGGLSAAVFGTMAGMKVMLCEKAAQLGGTTASSGGVVWIPGTKQARQAGISDSLDKAREYLQGELGNYYRADLVEAFLSSGGEALAALEAGSAASFELTGWPDYHPEQPGGVDRGRSLVVRPFDGRELGADFGRIRAPIRTLLVLGGMMVGPSDIPAFLRPFASWASFTRVTKRLLRYGFDRLRYSRGAEISNGNALVARLLFSLKQANATIWTDAPLLELIRRDGRIAGAVIERAGRRLRIKAKVGVVLATGGFPRNAELRAKHGPAFPHDHTLAYEGNTGDGQIAATRVGAAVDTELAAPGLWTPASVVTAPDGGESTFIYGYLDRGRPGVIAVNPRGRRFVNEANSYHDIVSAMYREGVAEDRRFYFICDNRFVRRHGLGAILPWPWTPSLRPFEKSGYVLVGASLAELAGKAGLPPAALIETVERHNAFAATGVDADFGKGSTSFNRLWGTPDAGPNPNLAPITQAPFVALRIVPATLGTTIGLKTDGDAAVLDEAGHVIPGLYACGNELASVMRGFYPGGGVTLGPAIVFAYRAVQQATKLQNSN